MEDILKKVLDFADSAHDGQKRKYTSEKYIVHPVRVMQTCREYTDSLPVLAAALLHDVLEDTAVESGELLEFLKTVMDAEKAWKTLKLVEELTDEYVKSAYPQWNRDTRKGMELKRIAKTSANAQTIKYADIIDNSLEIAVHDPAFARRYFKECRDILKQAGKGNNELYKKAIKTVNEGLSALK
ncbi:HD domain-containing protein [Flavobacterium sp. MK4S-17]|uniref:HD domain-containing protein n=1 Tax=Flavobacterium sp. MK4S-17 TaxID=2543737 RepID=UPI001359ABE9|nr:HD domain-containing protein [Flavobacterium sp. MK4S-17]